MKTKHFFLVVACALFISFTSFAAPVNSKAKISKAIRKPVNSYLGYVKEDVNDYYFIYGDITTKTVSNVKYGTTNVEANAGPVYSFNGAISGTSSYVFTGRVYLTASSFNVVYGPIVAQN